jgi:hypothetical protein
LKPESKSERLLLPPLRIFIKMESNKKIFKSFFELFTSRGYALTPSPSPMLGEGSKFSSSPSPKMGEGVRG